MKKLQILKAVLDLFWFFSIIGAIAMVVFLPFYLFNSNLNVPIKINGQVITSPTIFSKIILTIGVLSGLIFLYSIYLLRKVVVLFQKREIFNDEVISTFDLIGKLILLSSIVGGVTLFINNLVNKQNVDLSLNFGYSSFLVSIALGLFFMVISEIFKIAKNMKEENELTI